MATDKHVIKQVHAVFSGTDISGLIRSVTVNLGYGDVDVSALGDLANRRAKGVGDHQVTIEFIHKTALSESLGLLVDAFRADDVTTFVYRPKSGAKDADNPEFRCDLLVTQLPFGGNRGDAHTSSLTIPVDGQVTYDDNTDVHQI
ncbi:MAG: hypothetical protein AAF604_04580 [Acidobacteriota bacterium]